MPDKFDLPKFQIFSDFDGTIALCDVGDTLFKTFAEPDWITAVNEWKQGKITSRETLIRECALATVTKEALENYCDSQKIDPHFQDFFDYCQLRNYPLMVLSDGLGFYIERILRRHGFHDLEVRANKLIFFDHHKIKPEFPFYDQGCLVCGNCKGYHIRHHRRNGSIVIYIGDGLSDRCGVEAADIIFAKDELEDYCQQKKLTFFHYHDFNDILNQFKKIERQHD